MKDAPGPPAALVEAAMLDKLAQRYGQTPDRIRDADAFVLKVANTADLLVPPK